MAWAVVLLVVGLTAVAVVLLTRLRQPADLSEQENTASPRRHVMERPAGPDAEAMDPDVAGGREP